jgi:outer membrane protein assembly factor BamA
VPAQEDEREGGSTLVPLPVVFYQPETGLGFGVAANYYTRFTEAPPDQPDVTVPPSVFQLIAVYTVKSQIITTLKSELYLGGTRYRVLGDMGYSRFPTKFWGIGNDTPEEAEEDYTPERLTVLGIDAQRELMRGWYLGVTARAFYRKISEVETDGLLATGDVPGSDDGWSLGVGVVGTRDTRDLTTFPTSGSFHQLRALVYSSVWGSDFEYGTYLLDLRRYLPLGRRKTVAIRGLAWASSGTPPFDQLPQIGGDQLLRGYFQGRFTDRQLVAAQAEYRGPAFWRIGWVAFGGVGQVADTWGGFEADGFKTTVGAGIRFLISDRESLFIRADLGYGVDTGSTGFYLNIGEAF